MSNGPALHHRELLQRYRVANDERGTLILISDAMQMDLGGLRPDGSGAIHTIEHDPIIKPDALKPDQLLVRGVIKGAFPLHDRYVFRFEHPQRRADTLLAVADLANEMWRAGMLDEIRAWIAKFRVH